MTDQERIDAFNSFAGALDEAREEKRAAEYANDVEGRIAAVAKLARLEAERTQAWMSKK